MDLLVWCVMYLLSMHNSLKITLANPKIMAEDVTQYNTQYKYLYNTMYSIQDNVNTELAKSDRHDLTKRSTGM